MSDVRTDTEAILAAIVSLSDRFGAVEKRLGSLEERVGSLETRVGSLEARMGALEVAVSSVDQKVSGIARKLLTPTENVALGVIDIRGEKRPRSGR